MAAPKGVAVSGQAYAKMVLHALKHHDDAVCGLLIGPDKTQGSRKGEIICADAVPLLHTHMLHPQLRLGVGLVEALCDMDPPESSQADVPVSGSKQRITALYYCDVITLPEKTPVINEEAGHIARVLKQHYPDLLVCLLDFRELAEKKVISAFWAFSGASWSRVPEEKVRYSKVAMELAEMAMANSLYLNVADLDDHLADPSLSPLNPGFFSSFAGLLTQDAKFLCGDSVAESEDPPTHVGG